MQRKEHKKVKNLFWSDLNYEIKLSSLSLLIPVQMEALMIIFNSVGQLQKNNFKRKMHGRTEYSDEYLPFISLHILTYSCKVIWYYHY
jgi:hypothetical protein